MAFFFRHYEPQVSLSNIINLRGEVISEPQ
jgi:hypothetical protein